MNKVGRPLYDASLLRIARVMFIGEKVQHQHASGDALLFSLALKELPKNSIQEVFDFIF
jgi:hypothetical protein